MKKLLLVAIATGVLAPAPLLTAGAQEGATKEELEVCLKAVEQITGKKPSSETVKLCEEGKMDDAITAALSAE